MATETELKPPQHIWIDPDDFSGRDSGMRGHWYANNDHDLHPSTAVEYVRADHAPEVEKLRQAIGWIVDAADAAYNEDENNKRIHEIFNIAAQVAGITRRLPDENSPFEL